MKTSKRLLFFGNERLATGVSSTAPTLRALIKDGYDVAAVVSNYQPPRSRASRQLEIANIANKNGIPLLLPHKLIDIKDELADFKAEAAVLVAYGKIIPQVIINIFPRGIINIHPSLLPKYRGPTPIEQAILDGASQTGVSLMELAAKMDAGPLYAQETVELTGSETKQQLADKLLETGAQLLIRNLPSILDGSLDPDEQIDSEATYTSLLAKEDGLIDLTKPAEVLEREIRAYSGWPKSRIEVFGHEIIVTKAKAGSEAGESKLILNANPGWLEVQELIAPSGRAISGAEFMRGYSKPS